MINRSEIVWDIGETRINPLLFQDDIIAINKTKDIQNTVNVIETFQHLKRLEFHEGKTKKSIFNGKKKEEKIEINGCEIKKSNRAYIFRKSYRRGKERYKRNPRTNKNGNNKE